MAPPRKRLKTNQVVVNRGAFLNNLSAGGPISVILSFCDFQSLLRLRRVSRKHKQYANQAIEQVTQNTLQLLQSSELMEHKHGDGESSLHVQLQASWSEKYPSKKAMIRKVLEDLEDLVDLEPEDERRAKLYLDRTGWLDSDDLNEELAEPVRERIQQLTNSGGCCGEGWNVEIRYNRPVKRLLTTKSIVEKILNIEPFETYRLVKGRYKEVTVYELQGVSPKLLSIRHAIMCLLWSAALPHSIQYTHVTWEHRHSDYPSGDYDGYLCFRNVGGQQIELKGSRKYQKT